MIHSKHDMPPIPYGYGLMLGDLWKRYPLLYLLLKLIDLLVGVTLWAHEIDPRRMLAGWRLTCEKRSLAALYQRGTP